MFKELFLEDELEGKDQFKGWLIHDEYGYFEATRYGTGYSSINLYIEDGEYCSSSTNKHGDAGAKGGEWGKNITSAATKVKKEHRLSKLSYPEIVFIYKQIEKSEKTGKAQPLTDEAFQSQR